MSKWTNAKWWFGQTPEQLARAERRAAKLASAGESMQSLGWKLTFYGLIPLIVLVVTFPLGLVLGPLAFWFAYRWRSRRS